MESRGWYSLCVVPGVVFLVLAIGQCGKIFGQIEGYQRMVIPGAHTFSLEASDYTVFGEDTSEIAGRRYHSYKFTFDSPCTMVDAEGRTVAMRDVIPGMRKYALTRFRGKSMYEVTIPRAGRYTLRCDDDGTGTAVAAIGERVPTLTILAFVIFLLAAGITPMLTFWWVQERRRQAARAAAWR